MIRSLSGIAVSLLVLLTSGTDAAPVAISELANNFPSAKAFFEFEGSGSADYITDNYTTYNRLENDVPALQEDFLTGPGTLSDVLSGVSALAELNNISVMNRSETDRFPGAANSTSMTTALSYFIVENVTTVSFSVDMEYSMQLVTETANEYAYGYAEQSLGLYYFNNNRFTLLDEFHYFDEKGVTAGESFDATTSLALKIEHAFNNAPFTGQLFFESLSMAYTDVQGKEPGKPEPVPEPGISCLLIIGMTCIAGIRKYHEEKHC